MKPSLRWALIIGAAVVAVAALRFTLFRPKPIDVDVYDVAKGSVEDAVTNSRAGTVRSRHRAQLGVELPGKVARIPHREGSHVEKGNLLLELDTTTARMELQLAERDLDAARATVVSAEASAALANQAYERAVALNKQGLISEQDFDQATSRREVATSELAAARAHERRARTAIGLARDRLDHLRIVAPFDGVITQRFVEVGEAVTIGQPALEIMSSRELYVSAPIDEIDIGRIESGLRARVTLDPYRGVEWEGVVTRVAPYLDDVLEQNRTLEIEVDLRPDDALPWPKPGTSADVEVILDRRDDVLRVPTLSVIEGKRVLVARNGRAVDTDVEIGLKNWVWTEVRSGLSAGDAVITNLDQQGLRPGTRIAVRGDQEDGAAWAQP